MPWSTSTYLRLTAYMSLQFRFDGRYLGVVKVFGPFIHPPPGSHPISHCSPWVALENGPLVPIGSQNQPVCRTMFSRWQNT